MRKNLLCLIMSLVFAVACLEIGLRLLGSKEAKAPDAKTVENWTQVPEKIWTEYHDRLGWFHIKNKTSRLKTNFVDVEVHTNSDGFRGSRDYDKKRNAETRILALGDSFTFGFGVPDEAVFTAQLEAAVPSVEVVNLGVSGYGIDQMLLSYRLLGKPLQADIVLIGIYPEMFWRSTQAFTDAGYAKPYFFFSEDEGLRLKNNPVPERYKLTKDQFPPIYEISALRKVLKHSVLYSLVEKNVVRLGKNMGMIDPDLTVEWIVGREILKQLISEIRADGATPVIMTCPPERWLKHEEKTAVEKSVLRFADRHQVLGMSMSDALRKVAASMPVEKFYIPGDGHWSTLGHTAVSNTLLVELKAQGLLHD